MGFWFYMLVYDGDFVRFYFEIDGGKWLDDKMIICLGLLG